MTEYLFAYGTLLPGAAPAEIASVAARLKPIGEGRVRGLLYDLGHFPGAVLEANGNERGDDLRNDTDRRRDECSAQCFIRGTVFELPGNTEISRAAEILRALDAYEEFDPEDAAGSQFLRTRCVVSLLSGTVIECWIYVYNRGVKNVPLVEGGRWNAGTVSA